MKVGRRGLLSSIFLVLALALLIFGSRKVVLVEKMQEQALSGLVPVMGVLSRPIEAVDDLVRWVQQVAIVFSENKRLRDENRRLKQDQITAAQLTIDNQRLKKLLNVGEGKVTTVAAARVVADSNSPFFRSVLINRGRDHGLSKTQAVMNEDGIIGRPITVGASSARVLLATDINSRIPVKLARNGINMILEGDNSPWPRLSFLPIGETIAVGDRVLTSGYGMVFPPDLPVGQVIAVDDTGIKVELSAKLYHLNYVSIVGYQIMPQAGITTTQTKP